MLTASVISKCKFVVPFTSASANPPSVVPSSSTSSLVRKSTAGYALYILGPKSGLFQPLGNFDTRFNPPSLQTYSHTASGKAFSKSRNNAGNTRAKSSAGGQSLSFQLPGSLFCLNRRWEESKCAKKSRTEPSMVEDSGLEELQLLRRQGSCPWWVRK